MIILSVAVLWISSYPMSQYQILEMQSQKYTPYANVNDTGGLANDSLDSIQKVTSFKILQSPVSPWLVALDYLTLAWFMIDLSVRFIFSPDKNVYLHNSDNIIDIVATLWLIADLVINIYITSFLLHSIQVVRVLRLFRLLSYHPGLKVIILSIKNSGSILSLLLFFLIISSTMYGSLIFFAEKLTTTDPNNNLFISIPDAFWFSLVSLTTIGYGDISPVTTIGKFDFCDSCFDIF